MFERKRGAAGWQGRVGLSTLKDGFDKKPGMHQSPLTVRGCTFRLHIRQCFLRAALIISSIMNGIYCADV